MSVFDKYSEFNAFLVYSHLPALPKDYPPFIYLNKSSITIGRIRDNDVKIDGLAVKHMVSRTHTVITHQVHNKRNTGSIDEYKIEDRSMNGTYVNGKSLEGRSQVLLHNDRIRLGPTMSEIRYTFKRLDTLSDDNREIFDYIRFLRVDQLISDPLSRLFTPIYKLASSSSPTTSTKSYNSNSSSSSNNENSTTTTTNGVKRKVPDEEEEEEVEEEDEEEDEVNTKNKRNVKASAPTKVSAKTSSKVSAPAPTKASAKAPTKVPARDIEMVDLQEEELEEEEEGEEEEEEEDDVDTKNKRKEQTKVNAKPSAKAPAKVAAKESVVTKEPPLTRPTSTTTTTTATTTTAVQKRLPILRASTIKMTDDLSSLKKVSAEKDTDIDSNDSDYDPLVHRRKRTKDYREKVLYLCQDPESTRYGAWIVGKVNTDINGLLTIEGRKRKVIKIEYSKVRFEGERMSRKFSNDPTCMVNLKNAFYEARIMGTPKLSSKGDLYNIQYVKINNKSPFEDEWVHVDLIYRVVPYYVESPPLPSTTRPTKKRSINV